jgi:hypothetical protein
MEDFVRWSLQYDLWCKMRFFGEAIEEQEEQFPVAKNRGPQNLLDLLPDIFTRDEAQQMRIRRKVTGGSVGSMLSTWKNRKYIELYGVEMPQAELGRQQYAKTEFYLQKRRV